MRDGDAEITIVLADDHGVVRSGLRLLLQGEPDMAVVGEAGTRRPPCAWSRRAGRTSSCSTSTSRDPVLADHPEGLRGQRAHERRDPHDAGDPAFALRALQGGASGYVLKEAADEELVAAVRAAAAGRTHLDPQLGALLVAAPREPEGPPDDLTPRELENLRLIALGHTNAEIAGQLYPSVSTVESHRANVQQKLGRSSRAELVRYALDHGVVDR